MRTSEKVNHGEITKQYVIKSNCSSNGCNILLVTNKSKINIEKAEKILKKIGLID